VANLFYNVKISHGSTKINQSDIKNSVPESLLNFGSWKFLKILVLGSF